MMATPKKTSGKNGKTPEPTPAPEEPVNDWGSDLTPQPEKAVEFNVAVDQAKAILEQEAEEKDQEVEEATNLNPADNNGWGMAPEPQYSPLVIERHEGKFNPDIVKMLLYGESGTGKTRLASSFPDVLFADIDKGMASVTLPVDRVGIDNWKQLEELHAFLKGSAEARDYTTVVIDTLNEMQRLAMGMTIEEFQHIKRSYGNLPSQSDYGKMLHDMVELTRSFVALPVRVVLLAQVISKQFDTDVLQPQLVGKNTAREIARKMDVIGYTYKVAGEGEKQLLAVSFDAVDYVTKDRSFKLPSQIVEPSFSKIAGYWG